MLGSILASLFEPFNDFANAEIMLDDGVRLANSQIRFDSDAGEYRAVVELPGIPKDNVDVKVVENRVTIDAQNGERKFRTAFRIGKTVDQDSIIAEMKNGMLLLKFKNKEPEYKEIKIA